MAGLPKILSARLREESELGVGEGIVRFLCFLPRFAVLHFELWFTVVSELS